MKMYTFKEKIRIITLSIIVLSMAYVPGRLHAQDSGSIEMTLSDESIVDGVCQCTIEATGIGFAQQNRSPSQSKLMAERAAKVRAYRNLAQALQRTRPILSDQSNVIQGSGYVRGAKVIEKRYLPDGKVMVRMAIDTRYIPEPNEPCRSFLAKYTRSWGYQVYMVSHEIEDVGEEEWKTWNH
ncbi:MAG: hypothetical protein Q8Q33_02445 [Chlamydiota bacterium]|nr:hypothetical protein [Chlamydiota bacterium]